ncbi:DUF523 domain-containing protein [Myxococcota bacterium]|nr:DUF523 domain-containing protein [Myxococcota bacterium]MBU1899041.1 DUF523 domain-containing protein [Myxococcota bacterium]
MRRPRLGLSGCLLHAGLRYDGRDVSNPSLNALAERFELITRCPEVGAGMPTPRPPIDWVGDRIMDRAAGIDWTPPLRAWIEATLAELGPIHGWILKRRSPSCGLGSAARYGVDGVARVDGIWAAALRARWPALPLIDEVGFAADEAAFERQVWAYALADQARPARSTGAEARPKQ